MSLTRPKNLKDFRNTLLNLTNEQKDINPWASSSDNYAKLMTRVRVQSPVFREGTPASDLEMLTVAPTASRSAANLPCVCWKSPTEESRRTKSSAKSWDTILRSPTWTLSSPTLRLEILFMNITNRIGDKWQRWHSPTSTTTGIWVSNSKQIWITGWSSLIIAVYFISYMMT